MSDGAFGLGVVAITLLAAPVVLKMLGWGGKMTLRAALTLARSAFMNLIDRVIDAFLIVAVLSLVMDVPALEAFERVLRKWLS